jgi:hypothetical protein
LHAGESLSYVASSQVQILGGSMFLRVVRAAGGQGVKHEYVRVVEAYRDHDGKTRHHTVLNLGRRDLLAQHLDLDKLQRLLHGDTGGDDRARSEDVAAVGAWDWGPTLAARRMWNELGVDDILAELGGRGRGDGAALKERLWYWWPIASSPPAASMDWRVGWRPTSCATSAADAGRLPGATTWSAKQVGARACALPLINCNAGIVHSINCWLARRRSNMHCFCGSAICFRCKWTWYFMRSLTRSTIF